MGLNLKPRDYSETKGDTAMSKQAFWNRQPSLECTEPKCSKKYKHRLSLVHHLIRVHGYSWKTALSELAKAIDQYNAKVREINKRLEEGRR